MGLDGFETDPGVLVLRARDSESFDASRYGTVLEAGDLELTAEDIDSMRSDGLFPVKLSEEAGPGLIGGDWPDDIRETLSLVTDPQGRRALGSRRLTVRTGPGLTDAQIEKLCHKGDLVLIRRLGANGASFSVKIPRAEDPLEYAQEVRRELGSAVQRVLPEFLYRYRPAWTPLGPLYPKQWQWYEPTAAELAAADSAPMPIHVEAAWERAKGRGVRIAVIDKTFDVDHPDLTNAILDTSGHFESAELAEFQQGRAKVNRGTGSHGTFCAGMAAAHPVEGRGIVGAAPEANLVLLSIDSWTSLEIISRALEYVRGSSFERPIGCIGRILSWFVSIRTTVDFCEAEIVCMSNDPFMNEWEGYEEVLAALDELAKVNDEAGIPVFAPAGNDTSQDVSPDEVLRHPQVLVVSLVGEDGRWVYSSFGDCIDFAAPGYKVVSTYPQWGSYADLTTAMSGTSFAAPCAAGVAALMLCQRPWLSTSTIRTILRETCDEIPSVALPVEAPENATKEWVVGAGRINAERALNRALEQV